MISDQQVNRKRRSSSAEANKNNNDEAKKSQRLSVDDLHNNNDQISSRNHSVESEIRTLKALIPGLDKETNVGELEVIDACVFYIECLQRQLSDNEKENEKESNAIHKEDVG